MVMSGDACRENGQHTVAALVALRYEYIERVAMRYAVGGHDARASYAYDSVVTLHIVEHGYHASVFTRMTAVIGTAKNEYEDDYGSE